MKLSPDDISNADNIETLKEYFNAVVIRAVQLQGKRQGVFDELAQGLLHEDDSAYAEFKAQVEDWPEMSLD